MAEASAQVHTLGSKVWCKAQNDADSWQKGEVLRVEAGGATLVVKAEDGSEIKAKPEDLPLQNQDARGVEVGRRLASRGACTLLQPSQQRPTPCLALRLQDMTRLSYLHEPGVLWNLQCRYLLDDIYTYTGTILIAVNPFASLPHLYGTHVSAPRCWRMVAGV